MVRKMCPTDCCLSLAHMKPVPKKESITEAFVEGVKAEASEEESSEEQLISYSQYPCLKCINLMISCRGSRLRVVSVSIAVVLMVKVSPTTHRNFVASTAPQDVVTVAVLTRVLCFRNAFQFLKRAQESRAGKPRKPTTTG
jgi:uncharacterized membrane protein